ncbi:MAG: DUF805 domain-containing protein [Deltaproteobacteria bacterium]|nr:DUF805 domain-containing protein [Deltaproteobacteria bacterium]
MSAIQRAWSKKFSAEGRANRAEFWLFCLVIGLLYLVLSFVVGMIFGLAQVEQEYLIIPIIVIWIFVLILQIFLLIRRVHDFDCSGALALLILVPIAPIVLGLIPGTPGPNRFGLPPGGGYGPPPGGGYGPPPNS